MGHPNRQKDPSYIFCAIALTVSLAVGVSAPAAFSFAEELPAAPQTDPHAAPSEPATEPAPAGESLVAGINVAAPLITPSEAPQAAAIAEPAPDGAPVPDAAPGEAATEETKPLTVSRAPFEASGVEYREDREAVRPEIRIEADEPTGALALSFPIAVPPGRNGMEPALALTYASQRQELASMVGFGWAWEMPAIERINRKGAATLYTENFFRSSLDGEIIRAESAPDTENYGAKVENGAFRKYEFRDRRSWKVTDKRGVVYTFGASPAGRMDDPANADRVYRWMLERIEDPNGNFVAYEYAKDQGEIYPWRIRYTGHGADPGLFEVEFLRESRADVAASRATGFPVTTQYRISEIQVKVNGAWTRKYAFAYAVGDNGVRSLLAAVTETGRDEDTGAVLTLPPTRFEYETAKDRWLLDANYRFGGVPAFVDDAGRDNGARFADVNGDGLPDIIRTIAASDANYLYLNNGDGTGWTESTAYNLARIPAFLTSNRTDYGTRIFDVNGDGFDDIVRIQETEPSNAVFVNRGDGTGWVLDPTYDLSAAPPFIEQNGITDTGTRIADINGDGLVDLFRLSSHVESNGVYLNTGDGTGWRKDPNYVLSGLPLFTDTNDQDNAVRIADANGDRLPDIIRNTGGGASSVFLNKGDGTGWIQDPNYDLRGIPGFLDVGATDNGVRIEDINGDGLADFFRNKGEGNPSGVYLNTGDGTGWQKDDGYDIGSIPPLVETDGRDTGARFADINGDGLPDLALVRENSAASYLYRSTGERADLLRRVVSSAGAATTVAYRGSPEFSDGAGLMNPRLSLRLDLVEAIGVGDGFTKTATTSYAYRDGEFYFSGSYDREFALFGSVVKTDALGVVTRTFYHQGAGPLAPSRGEYEDHIAKKGRAYRAETYDAGGNIVRKTIHRWERAALPGERSFVYQSRATDFAYDGDADHRAKAEGYAYDAANGDLLTKTAWGEVTGSDDGSFADIGTDNFTTTFAYAANTALHLLGLPSRETVTDGASSVVKDTRFSYDGLALGEVVAGNETRRESWKSGSSWIGVEKRYDAYGLVVQETDPRSNTTDYGYDPYHLGVATRTNAVGHATGYAYDYSSGKAKRVTDPNGRVSETVFDALDRVREERGPDDTNPATLVARTTYAYTDAVGARMTKTTSHLDASAAVDEYAYLDGFGRVIQSRRAAEEAGMFIVRDLAYDPRGLVEKESLPYFSSGSARTAATADSALFTAYAYDALGRPTRIGRSTGDETRMYGAWRTTVIDPLGRQRVFHRNAYGGLARVEEANAGAIYATAYAYDVRGNLTRITDAEGNIRAFTYDGLGRRTTAEDLHAPGDATFGVWTYAFDDAGNRTAGTDPEGRTVNYAYDGIGRVLVEDFAGTPGADIAYTYDACAEGAGRLCAAAFSGSATTTYAYTPTGRLKSETKTIAGRGPFPTSYAYDRQGNTVRIAFPDGGEVAYGYNAAGFLESAGRKAAGSAAVVPVVAETAYAPTGEPNFMRFANGAQECSFLDVSRRYRLVGKRTVSFGLPCAVPTDAVMSTSTAASPDSGTEDTTAATTVTTSVVRIYGTAGDGYVTHGANAWPVIHDAVSGRGADYAGSTGLIGVHEDAKTSGSARKINRFFFTAKTASLPPPRSTSTSPGTSTSSPTGRTISPSIRRRMRARRPLPPPTTTTAAR